jgi:hypothetical protein
MTRWEAAVSFDRLSADGLRVRFLIVPIGRIGVQMGSREHLMNEIDGQIGRFDKESTKHKRMYRAFRYTIFLLSGTATVLAGVSLAHPQMQHLYGVLIVITTALAAFVTSVDGVRKPNELWIHERTTLYQLKDLKRELEFQSAIDKDAIQVADFFQRLQDILGASGKKWSGQIVSRASKTDKPARTDPNPPPKGAG